MKILSSYEQIDILKFLNFNQLFSVQQTNYYFNLLINQNKWILALKELHRISLVKFNSNYNVIDHSNVVYYPVNDELLFKWQSAIDKQLSLYLFCNDGFQGSKYCSFYLTTLNKEKCLKLKLPIYPKNIKEMQIIRFYLKQLFRCSFDFAEFDNVIFNYEMINLLFENNKNNNIKARIVQIYFHNSIYKYQFEFILNYLVITNYILLNFKNMDDMEEQYNFLFKLLLNSGKRISCVSIEKTNTLSAVIYSFINYIKMSTTDCLEIVPNIKFFGKEALRLQIEHFADKTQNYENDKIALCEYKNIYNSKIKFLAKFDYNKLFTENCWIEILKN